MYMSHSALSTAVCSKRNGINFHGLETDTSNAAETLLCSYLWGIQHFSSWHDGHLEISASVAGRVCAAHLAGQPELLQQQQHFKTAV